MYNRKILTMVAAAAQCLTLSFPCMSKEYNNFYVGGTLGKEFYNTTISRKYHLGAQKSDSVSVGGAGEVVGINVGCFKAFQNIALGLESGVNFNTASGTVDTQSANLINQKFKISKEHTFYTSLKIGKCVESFFPYAKAGFAFSKWVLNSTNNVVSPVKSKKNNYRRGLILGGGIDYLTNRNFSIGFEYSLEKYECFKFNHVNLASFKIKPKTHNVLLNFRWHFI